MKKNHFLALALTVLLLIDTAMLGACNRQVHTEENKPLWTDNKDIPNQETSSEPDTNQQDISEIIEEQREIQAPQIAKEDYPKVDGSTATLPLSTALYQLVTGATQEEAESSVIHTKTTNAYKNLLSETTDLVIAYEPSQSVYNAMETEGKELLIKPIGKDALVFMANQGNPLTSLSSTQLMEIYSGKYKNWSQLGGEYKELIAFQRPEDSGSQTLMEKLVMKGVPMAEAPQSRIVGDMGELIEQVASYNNEENALGYSVYFYARNMYQNPSLKFMAVDGVMPDNDSIKSGSYPYVNEFYVAVRNDEPKDSFAYQLFEWLSGTDGQALIESLGYVGMQEPTDIHVQIKEDKELKPGTVALTDDTRILINGSYLTGENGIVVLGSDFEVQQIINDKYISETIKNIRGDEAIIMTDLSTGLTGLYSIEKESWILEPVYEYLWPEKNGIYSGSRQGKWEQCKIFWNEEEQCYEERFGGYVQIGDFWWKLEENTCEIFEEKEGLKEGTIPIKVIDFSNDDKFNYGYADRNFYIVNRTDNSQEVYDEQGDLIFGEQSLGKPFQIYDVNPQCHWVWAAEVGNERNNKESLLYDFDKKRLLTQPGDFVENIDGNEDYRYFSVIRNGTSIVCNEDGQPLISQDNKGFDRIFKEGWCGSQENNIMVIERPLTGERFEIPWGEDTNGYLLMNRLFFIQSEIPESYEAFYLEDTCLMKEKALMYWECGDSYVLSGDNRGIVINHQGEILYEGNQEERVIEVFPEYLAIQRGNYLYLTDYEGKSVFRHLLGYMGND